MRTSRTYNRDNLSTETPSYKKVLRVFNTFSEEELIQRCTLNKFEYDDDATDGIINFMETVFENIYGKVTIRLYLSGSPSKRGRYSGVFETTPDNLAGTAKLGILVMPNSNVRLYDGEHYYKLPDGYLTKADTLECLVNFVRDIPYYGEEEFKGEFLL